MKSKNMYLIVPILAILVFAILGISNHVKAADLNPNLYLGIQEFREGTIPENMGYAIGKPDFNGSTEESRQGYKIWKIVKYSSENDNVGNTSTSYYCVKAGVGFSDENKKATYDRAYDLIRERDAIINTNSVTLQNIVGREAVQEQCYWGIVALADLIYVPETSTEQDRINLLNRVGIAESRIALTKDDMDAVQQATFWYFTNYDNTEGNVYTNIFNKYQKENWFNYKTPEEANVNPEYANYHSLSDYDLVNKTGQDREIQAYMLYDYLIRTALENMPKYQSGEMVSPNKITLYTKANDETNTQPVITIEKAKPFDLALRKYITKVGTTVLKDNGMSREPVIDESKIATEGTAHYKHRKDPVPVKIGDTVTYNITIYNEGAKNGRALEIVDQLPTGLKFSKLNTSGFTANYNEELNKLTIIREDTNTEDLNAYTGGTPDSETLEIECIVSSSTDMSKQTILTNVAWIQREYNSEDNQIITDIEGEDRDSTPEIIPQISEGVIVNKDNMSDYKGKTEETDLSKEEYYPGQEDDDDFEKLVLEPQYFDLRLKKTIYEINSQKVEERILDVDIKPLVDKTATDADIKMNKDPITVKKGDIVKYRIRVYNEGDIDGYASEVSEDVPEGLEFMWSDKTQEELEKDTTLTQEEIKAILYNQLVWLPKTINGETQRIDMVTTDYLAKGQGLEKTEEKANLIKAFDPTKEYVDTEREKNPDYKDVYVYMKVISEKIDGQAIRNEAAITQDTDANGQDIDDRDSQPENWPGRENREYQDDEDYDNIIIQNFDLALRKFISKVDTQTIDTRIPQINYDKQNNKITYTHPKEEEPVEVITDNIVTYTIRVFNEGQQNGYAAEITDDLPDGLEFLPEDETNKEYRWVMYDSEGKETNTVSNAVKIATDYLSKEQGEARKESEGENPALLKAFDPEEEISDTNPDYKDVKVAFKVVEPNSSNRIIVNSAQISEDTDENGNEVDDIDSIPGEWNEGEDDQDKEYIKLTYFDLALRKWVTQAIVIENGKETVTQTGHTPEQDPEPIVKVEVHRNKLNQVTVKFRFAIRVTNEGDIAGYAKEITDYIPEGLKFVAADNPGWTETEDNMVTTNLLADKLLKPGESADVEILLTWINGSSNMGLKTNVAEISKDYNDKGAPDRDSTPGNRQPGEDDIDDAPVMLSIKTGKIKTYIILGLTSLIIMAGGIALIKKYVL